MQAGSFYFVYTDAPKDPLRCLYSPVLAVQKYKQKVFRRPTYLRIALTPTLLQGVYPAATGFRPKLRDLHARLIALVGFKAGRLPEQLLRLTAWLLTLPKRPTVSLTDRTLAERLRSQNLQHSQVAKFRLALTRHLEITRQLGLIKDFTAPTQETGGKWSIKLL